MATKKDPNNFKFKQDEARLVIEKAYTHQKAADNQGISLTS